MSGPTYAVAESNGYATAVRFLNTSTHVRLWQGATAEASQLNPEPDNGTVECTAAHLLTILRTVIKHAPPEFRQQLAAVMAPASAERAP